MSIGLHTLELLAPARDAATAMAAIAHGADAVYMGGPAFGARSAAGNSIDDIKSVIEYAHRFGVRVYITLNTIIYEHELDAARSLVTELYAAGVDALIVQDMALTEMDIPPVDLHASTQCDARTPEKVAALAAAGFSQIVLPREFSIEEIRRAAQAAAGADIEVFVHGALCVSYSGDCQAGFAMMGRSANRGECPQICRLEFRLTDAQGRTVTPPDEGRAQRHWLSLADMNRLAYLAELADAGVNSFKIEGRLKSISYVKQVTAAYSAALDRLVEANPDKYRRASYGRSRVSFTPDLSASFNRGFTGYFLKSARESVSSTLTPKWTGPAIGRMTARKGNVLEIDSKAEIHAGDGMGWFDGIGKFHGFRVNRAEPGRLYVTSQSDAPTRAALLYRNLDTVREHELARTDTGVRTISVKARLTVADGNLTLELTDERGAHASACVKGPFTDMAQNPQTEYRRDIIAKLGGTIYRLTEYTDEAGALFLPAKTMTSLRREAVAALDAAYVYHRRRRKTSELKADAFAGKALDYHDNVANSLSRRFYTSHGAEVSAPAMEVKRPAGDVRVMTTKYCLRREQGACLRIAAQACRMPAGDLYLEAPAGRLRLHCDCDNCQMKIYLTSKK